MITVTDRIIFLVYPDNQRLTLLELYNFPENYTFIAPSVVSAAGSLKCELSFNYLTSFYSQRAEYHKSLLKIVSTGVLL